MSRKDREKCRKYKKCSSICIYWRGNKIKNKI